MVTLLLYHKSFCCCFPFYIHPPNIILVGEYWDEIAVCWYAFCDGKATRQLQDASLLVTEIHTGIRWVTKLRG